MIGALQQYNNFAIINMEGGTFPHYNTLLEGSFFMLEQNIEILQETEQEIELRLSFFDLNRPYDWVGHERELMQELDAPGCYITKPAPISE